MADLVLRIGGENNASGILAEVKDSVVVLGAALIDFGKQAVEAFNEQEKADRQLAMVAGASTEAFKKQAEALQQSIGVSDDMVETMQTMLLRFGEAPDQVDKTVRALLDYSAATGTDAVSATQTLLSSVQSGKTAFKELGLEYEKTGEVTSTLNNVTAALAKSVGGSAEAEGDSLAGRTRKLTEAWGEMKEAFGAFIAEIEARFGVLEKLSALLRNVTDGMKITGRFMSLIGAGASPGEAINLMNIQDEAMMLSKNTNLALGQPAMGGAGLSSVGRTRATGSGAGGGGGIEVGASGFEGLGMLGAGSVYTGDQGKFLQLLVGQENIAALHEGAGTAGEDLANEFIEGYRRGLRGEGEGVTSTAGIAGVNASTGFLAAQDDETNKQFLNAGLQIGTQFATGMLSALKELQKGGKFDAAQVIGNVVSGLFAVAGHIIGAYFGGPGGAQVGPMIGSLAGEAANMGIQEIGRASSAEYRDAPGINTGKDRARNISGQPKKHTGGWIGVPSFHDGGWFGDEGLANLQTGERVLSRSEVAAMGGPRGVDAAATGAGGVNVYITTMDGTSARDFFERQGGRAMLNAVRTGRGALPLFFGEG